MRTTLVRKACLLRAYIFFVFSFFSTSTSCCHERMENTSSQSNLPRSYIVCKLLWKPCKISRCILLPFYRSSGRLKEKKTRNKAAGVCRLCFGFYVTDSFAPFTSFFCATVVRSTLCSFCGVVHDTQGC